MRKLDATVVKPTVIASLAGPAVTPDFPDYNRSAMRMEAAVVRIIASLCRTVALRSDLSGLNLADFGVV